MRILVVSGASGGHIFPAAAFLEAVLGRQDAAEILLVLPKKSINLPADFSSLKIEHISITAVGRSISFKNIAAIFNFFKGSLQSLLIILNFRPDIVVGFGSLVSVPVVLFAWLFRIKTMIHEQNVIPGSANRLLAIFADRIAISLRESSAYLSKYQAKTVFTGNPLRRKLRFIGRHEAAEFFGFCAKEFTILVLGGSQGSRSVNEAFLKSISDLRLLKPQVIHIAGPADYGGFKNEYAGFGFEARVFDFFSEMQYAYSAADLVVSRAGATTIAELIFFKVPAILCPYPYACAHQAANADILVKIGAAAVVKEDDLGTGKLKKEIEEAIRDPEKINRMRSAYGSLTLPAAADLLAEEVIHMKNA